MDKLIMFRFNRNFSIGGLIFIIILFLFLLYYIIFGMPQRPPKRDMWPLAFLAAIYLFLGFCFIRYFFIPAVNQKPAMELNERGLIYYVDNTTIYWDNVANIRLIRNGMFNFIAIDLRNKNEITSKTKNVFKRITVISNSFLYGSPVLINTIYIKGKSMETFNVIMEYYQQIKNRRS